MSTPLHGTNRPRDQVPLPSHDVSRLKVNRSESSTCVRFCRDLMNILPRSDRSNSEMSDVESVGSPSNRTSQKSQAMDVDGTSSDFELTTSSDNQDKQEKRPGPGADPGMGKRKRPDQGFASEGEVSKTPAGPLLSKRVKLE